MTHSASFTHAPKPKGAAERLRLATPADSGAASGYPAAIRAFADIASALHEKVEIDDLLRLVGKSLCELVGTPRCSLYLRDERSGLFRGQVGYADHDIDAQIKRLTCGTPADGFTREIIETGAPVVIENAANDPRPVQSTMREWHVVSMMGVPIPLHGEVIGLVFLDAEDQAQQFTTLDRTLAMAFAELAAVAIDQSKLYSALRSSLETVARQNRALLRVSAIDEKLTGLVLGGRNLKEIAEAITELTHKPCAIYDQDHHRVANALPAGADDASSTRLLEPEFATKPEIAEALAALPAKASAIVGPFPNSGLPHRYLVAPVTVRDERWATLVMVEQGVPFNGFDKLMSSRTATVIALELSAARRVANFEWNARASLVGELIRGNSDISQLESRAQFVGMDLDQPHVLCLIGSRSDDPSFLPDMRTVSEAFAAAAPNFGVSAASVPNGVAVIVEAPADLPALGAVAAVKEIAEQVCRELSSTGPLIAGLSTVCRGPRDYVRASAQAQQVVRCLDTFHRPGSVNVLAADDLGAGRMFLANADADEAERFVEETLGQLLGDAIVGDLLLTLSSFFDNGRSIRWSAAELGVHENTVRYRLSRIEELTGLDVASNADAQLSAQLALLVLRLQGRLPSRAYADPQSPSAGTKASGADQTRELDAGVTS